MPVFQSNLAWILLENHQETDRALKLAQDAYENDPGSVAFADTLGWAYYNKGIYSQAIWLLSEAEKKDPDNGFIKYHLGMTYYQKGEIEKAMEYLKSAEQSKESKYFAQNLSDILNTLSNKKPITLEGMNQKDIDESILSPPEIEKKDDDMILPQWKQ
jgi:tetratricopeptide (TPR) repeat protein